MTPLDHRLDRTLVIHATRDTVFRFFTDSARWASWWGEGSSIDPNPGGRVSIRYPNGIEASGELVEMRVPERIVFTFGYANHATLPPGSSVVTITLEDVPRGTRLRLEHALPDAALRDEHVQGWRYQLSLFANRVCDEVNADAATRIDAWFGAWAEPDAAARKRALAAIARPDVRFRDAFSSLAGLDELSQQIGAAQRFMPGIVMRRDGEVRHCQGMALAGWTAAASDGAPRGSGTNVYVFDAEGRIRAVTGFWVA